MSSRFVVSTVEIGIVINSHDSEERPQWHDRFTRLSNAKSFSFDQGTSAKAQGFQNQALTRLVAGDVALRRRLSPQLNGRYRLYDSRLNSDADIH